MDNELLPLIRELCHIVVTRNDINNRRHRARFRKNYYANAIRVVEAFNESNYELREVEKRLNYYHPEHQITIDKYDSKWKWEDRANIIKSKMNTLRSKYINHKKPLKWQVMGLHKLRSLMLKAEGEYATAKHETMELSLRTTDRVKEILKMVQGSIRYGNGSVVNISIKGQPMNGLDIADQAAKYQLDISAEEMLEEQ